jgi:hypothetical protein
MGKEISTVFDIKLGTNIVVATGRIYHPLVAIALG